MHTSAAPAFDCLFEERAGIMQYDGGLSRGEAEQKAWIIVYRKMETYTRRDGSKGFKHTLHDNRPPAQKTPPAAEQLELITREQYLEGMQRYLK